MSGPASDGPSGPGGPPAAGPAPGLVYGAVGVRLVAYIIDGIIVSAISSALSGVFGLGWLVGGMDVMHPGDFPFGGTLEWGTLGVAWLAWLAVTTVISGLYFVGLWMRNGATFGQLVLGLEVRNAADGARPTQDQAIRRWAFLTVPVLSSLPALGFLVFIYQVYLLVSTNDDPAKQGFHDKQVGTVVVRRAT